MTRLHGVCYGCDVEGVASIGRYDVFLSCFVGISDKGTFGTDAEQRRYEKLFVFANALVIDQ